MLGATESPVIAPGLAADATPNEHRHSDVTVHVYGEWREASATAQPIAHFGKPVLDEPDALLRCVVRHLAGALGIRWCCPRADQQAILIDRTDAPWEVDKVSNRAVQHDDVGPLARLQGAEVLIDAEQFGG